MNPNIPTTQLCSTGKGERHLGETGDESYMMEGGKTTMGEISMTDSHCRAGTLDTTSITIETEGIKTTMARGADKKTREYTVYPYRNEDYNVISKNMKDT